MKQYKVLVDLYDSFQNPCLSAGAVIFMDNLEDHCGCFLDEKFEEIKEPESHEAPRVLDEEAALHVENYQTEPRLYKSQPQEKEECGYQRRCVGCDRVFYVTDDVPAACPDYPTCQKKPQEKEWHGNGDCALCSCTDGKHEEVDFAWPKETLGGYLPISPDSSIKACGEPQPKKEQIKPSQWIGERANEVDRTIFRSTEQQFIQGILDFLDQHFSK